MRKKTLLVMLCTCVFGMTGCESAIALSEQQENVMAEYLAGTLLKNDENYDQALIEPTPEPTPEPTNVPEMTATPTPEATTESSSGSETGSSQNKNEQANADFTQVIGIDGITAEYIGYEVVDNYSFNSSHSFEAGKNKSLFVVKFEVKNTSNKDTKLKLGDAGISYQLNLDTKYMLKPLLTYVDNDLRYLDASIKAGQKMETVVIFEITKDFKAATANVIISKDDKTAIIKVK